MAQATGIHIGRRRIAAIALRGSPKSPKVIGIGSCLRPEDPSELGATVRALCTERGLPRDPSVLTLSNDTALMRTISLPFTSAEQIRRVLKGEAEAALAGLSVEEMVLGSHFIGAADNEGQIVAVAMRKDTLRPILASLAGSGIDPVSIDLEGFTLANAIVCMGHAPESGAVVVIECDLDEVRFALMVDQRVKVVRSVGLPLAVPAAPIAVENDGDETPGADAPGPDPLAHDEHRTLDLNHDALPEFESELTRTLVAGGLMDQPQRVLLLGPMANEPAIAAAVERVVGVGPEVADLLADADATGPDSDAAASAFGAALKGLGFDHSQVNLRVDEFAFKRRFDQVAGALATFVTLAFLVLLVLLLDLRDRNKSLSNEWVKEVLSPAFQRFRDVAKEVVKDDAKRGKLVADLRDKVKTPRDKLVTQMTNRMLDWATDLQGGPVKSEFNARSALDVWRAWADHLMAFQPRPKYWVLDHIEIELRPSARGRVSCKGWVDTETGRAAIDNMKASLQRHPDFRDTKPGTVSPGTRPDGEQGFSFSITSTLPPEIAPKKGGGRG